MSEPITLYDADGNEVIMYSPTVAHFAVQSGKLFAERPVVAADAVPQDDVAPQPKRGRPRKVQEQIL